MLNAERNDYKLQAATAIGKHFDVRTHCHDCACNFQLPARKCLLDSWHAIKHKCSKKKFDPKHNHNAHWIKDCNSEAVEQLWSRTDKLAPFATHFARPSFRMFLRSYCQWRNDFVRDPRFRSDTSKTRSWKRSLKRGDLVHIKKARK